MQRRNSLSESERNTKNKVISDKLITLLQSLSMKSVAIYMPIRNEVDITSIFPYFDKVAIPKVLDNQTMSFYPIKHLNDVKIGAFNVLEPLSNELVNAHEIDAIIVPMVGFDEYKSRIGYGKGYYDYYLNNNSITSIGVAYEIQKMNKIDIEHHDVTLDYIVSETKTYN